MLVDVHAHYPMQVIGDVVPDTLLKEAKRARNRPTLRDRVRAIVLRIASTFFSHRSPVRNYRVSVNGMRSSGVGVAMSVLTSPFEEAGLGRPFGSAPESQYFQALLKDMQAVEDEIATHPRDELRLVRNLAELDDALDAKATALVHALEGGFSLGEGVEEVKANVATLKERGVVYITLAHLLYRQVATNCSAFPFLNDKRYRKVFPQPEGVGLTDRGVAALSAMVDKRVLLDIAHMRQDALDVTWRLLDEEFDPRAEYPVLATHVGYRFGEQEYMLTEATVLQIKRRNGLIGLILAQHQLNDGRREEETETFEDSLKVIFDHIDKLADILGGYEHLVIGTDFDGFIKPTMTGLDNMGDLARLERKLEERYKENARLITSENALRVLRRLWS